MQWGCQKDIAAKIKSKEAEYILAVKDNQEHLHDDIKDAFTDGTIEVCKTDDWQGLQTLIEIKANEQ